MPVFHIGHVIRSLRKAKGLTLIELAERSGLSKTTLSRIESTGGNFENRTIERIAGALDTSAVEIFGAVKASATQQPATSGDAPGAAKAQQSRADDQDTIIPESLDLRIVMANHMKNPAFIEAMGAFARLTTDEQEDALDYMRELRRRRSGRGRSRTRKNKAG